MVIIGATWLTFGAPDESFMHEALTFSRKFEKRQSFMHEAFHFVSQNDAQGAPKVTPGAPKVIL